MNSRTTCRYHEQLPAYLQRELDDSAARELERHLEACASCAKALDEFRGLTEHLQRDPDQIVSRDLTPDILKRIDGDHNTVCTRQWPLLRIAALVAGMLGTGFLCGQWWLRREASEPITTTENPAALPAMTRATDWLCRTQEADGHWDTARWGAQKNYAPGITALALLALMNDTSDAGDEQRSAALEKGLDYLTAAQGPDGRIGAFCSGTPYNQGMGTLALVEACERLPGARWQEAADRGIAYILDTQRPSGGWGYPREENNPGNTSITVWQLQALLRAEEQGRKDIRPCIEKALAWVSSLTDSEGRIGYSRAQEFPNGYETLTAAGALCMLRAGSDAHTQKRPMLDAVHQAAREAESIDYYRYYFLTHALRTENTAQSRQLAAALKLRLAATQTLRGEHSGSWEPDDRWSSAGGRIYTTAMAALSMK